MGYYIQGPSLGKVDFLINTHEAKIITNDKAIQILNDNDSTEAVIICVDNGMFEAAGYCFNMREFESFTKSRDSRPKTVLSMDKTKAKELSGYKD